VRTSATELIERGNGSGGPVDGQGGVLPNE